MGIASYFSGVPEISFFEGIHIRMHYADHGPPHVHAITTEHEALVDIRTGVVIRGTLTKAEARLVRRWVHARGEELADFWSRASHLEPLGRIEPLV